MSGIAIVLMLISMITIWGGLILALINLSRHPELPEDPEDDLIDVPTSL